jgi:hypothetical protein
MPKICSSAILNKNVFWKSPVIPRIPMMLNWVHVCVIYDVHASDKCRSWSQKALLSPHQPANVNNTSQLLFPLGTVKYQLNNVCLALVCLWLDNTQTKFYWFSTRAQRDGLFNFDSGSGSGFDQNFGNVLGSGSGLKIASGFWGDFFIIWNNRNLVNFLNFGWKHYICVFL